MKKHVLRFLLRFALTAALLAILARSFPTIFSIGGGIPGLLAVAAILALLNTIVYPVIRLVTLPFRLVSGVIVSMLTNIVLLWVTLKILAIIGPDVATLTISGGVVTWGFTAILLGLTHLLP